MIEISNGKIYVDGKETRNAELIGLSLLDSLEKDLLSKEIIKKKYLKYLKDNKLRRTRERDLILDIILEKKQFSNAAEIKKEFDKNRPFVIYMATFYNSIQLFMDSGIIQKQSKKYALTSECFASVVVK